uniref:Uncharacterized protein n=1 Tax=Globodera rostochiensis TaxID=31243 RepID=A0A914HD42_GLORO
MLNDFGMQLFQANLQHLERRHEFLKETKKFAQLWPKIDVLDPINGGSNPTLIQIKMSESAKCVIVTKLVDGTTFEVCNRLAYIPLNKWHVQVAKRKNYPFYIYENRRENGMICQTHQKFIMNAPKWTNARTCKNLWTHFCVQAKTKKLRRMRRCVRRPLTNSFRLSSKISTTATRTIKTDTNTPQLIAMKIGQTCGMVIKKLLRQNLTNFLPLLSVVIRNSSICQIGPVLAQRHSFSRGLMNILKIRFPWTRLRLLLNFFTPFIKSAINSTTRIAWAILVNSNVNKFLMARREKASYLPHAETIN